MDELELGGRVVAAIEEENTGTEADRLAVIRRRFYRAAARLYDEQTEAVTV